MSSEECRRQILEKYQELADALEKENRQLKDELRGVKKESGDSEVRQIMPMPLIEHLFIANSRPHSTPSFVRTVQAQTVCRAQFLPRL